MKLLSQNQKKFLAVFGQEKQLLKNFYLTGGTALIAFYLPYRLSEDLDFFSEKEFDLKPILVFLKNHQKDLGYSCLDFNTSFNRNMVHLRYKGKGESLKLEFTYFPFPQIKKPIIREKIKVDSLLDIAVNKLFTIYQKPRARDFIDLYMIIKKHDYKISDLIKKAKLKFDWHVDSLKLGSQFLKVNQFKDFPKLKIKLKSEKWQVFFITQARDFEKKILK